MLKPEIVLYRSSGERRLLLTLAVLAVAAFVVVKPVASETQDPTSAERKVVTRVEPEYPETLKRLYIGGIVRVEAVIAANGAVVSTQLLGGNPILGQSAMKAIKQWKYSPANAKGKLVVQLEFDPHR
jgi:TonB family protein